MISADTRKKFVTDSGRYDLVVDTTTWADNGADFFLESGEKYLNHFLTAKIDANKYEHLLLLSGLRMLEVFNHNSMAIRILEDSLQEELVELEKDTAADESIDVDEFVG